MSAPNAKIDDDAAVSFAYAAEATVGGASLSSALILGGDSDSPLYLIGSLLSNSPVYLSSLVTVLLDEHESDFSIGADEFAANKLKKTNVTLSVAYVVLATVSAACTCTLSNGEPKCLEIIIKTCNETKKNV